MEEFQELLMHFSLKENLNKTQKVGTLGPTWYKCNPRCDTQTTNIT